MDQTIENVNSLNSASNSQRCRRRSHQRHQRFKLDAAVWTAGVVMLQIPSEDTL
jgi:hypothetical protein